MDGKIVIYKASSSNKSTQLYKALHGYTDRSNHGKYTYQRDGLLDEIPHRKVIKGVFILRKKDSQKFVDLLEKYEIEHYVRNIELMAEDEEILSSSED